MEYLTHHLLRNAANVSPDKESLVDRRQRLTFAEAYRATSGVAEGLRRAGLARADRVGILLDPSVDQALSIFGVSQAGGVFVPIHHSLLADQVSHIIRDCGMTALITSRAMLSRVQPALQQSMLRFVALVDDPRSDEQPLPCYSLPDWMRDSALDAPQDVGIGRDLAAILYTSGSTGKPKGVMLSHDNLIAGASIVSDYLEITHEDRILAALPFTFDAGLNQLTTAVQQRGTLVTIHFLFGRDIVQQLVEERITGLAGVPPLWSLLVQASAGLQSHGPRLRYITNTGGAMPLHLLEKLRTSLPETSVYLMYGLTEAFRSTYLPPAELERRPGSIGKAIPNTEILVVNDEGQPCGPGEVGELVHHGPTVSLGYWGHPELTNRVLRPHPFPPAGAAEPPRVCYSGDLVRVDADGFLYFVGRRDDLIKSSGFRISPTEVEEGLFKSGRLREVGVVGVPDEMLGQRIIAFVVPKEDESPDAGELIAHCATVMPRHMVPRAIEIQEHLPKTSSGKINYAALRQLATPAPEGSLAGER